MRLVPSSLRRRLLRVRRSLTRSRRASRSPLALAKAEQRARYDALRGSFAPLYENLRELDIRAYTVPYWDRTNATIERDLLPFPPFDFLNHPIILEAMVASGRTLRSELAYLERFYGRDHLGGLLREDLMGDPELHERTYLTSHNVVHQLFHLARFAERTAVDPSTLRTVLEWGGGYGCLAKVFVRLAGDALTYVIIDTPLFVSLQWLYLSVVLGPERVRVLQQPSTGIAPGQVNLVPVSYVNTVDVNADLFVSIWGLSECSRYAQEQVASRRWFDGRHLLVVFQRPSEAAPEADLLRLLLAESGAIIEGVDRFPGNFYAFR